MNGGFQLKTVSLDGRLVVKLRCPRCGVWAEIDDDQLAGRVSVHHDDPECGWHETHDFRPWLAEGWPPS